MNVTEVALLSIIVSFAKSFRDRKFNVQIFVKSFLLFFVSLYLIDLLLAPFLSGDSKENGKEINGAWLIGGIILLILLSFAKKLFVRR